MLKMLLLFVRKFFIRHGGDALPNCFVEVDNNDAEWESYGKEYNVLGAN